jgi:hypothetical protein
MSDNIQYYNNNAATMTVINNNYDWKLHGVKIPRPNFIGKAKLITVYKIFYTAPYIMNKVIESEKIIWY